MGSLCPCAERARRRCQRTIVPGAELEETTQVVPGWQGRNEVVGAVSGVEPEETVQIVLSANTIDKATPRLRNLIVPGVNAIGKGTGCRA